MWGNGPGQQAPSWMNEDNDGSEEVAAAPAPASTAAVGASNAGASKGGGGWFSGSFNKPRNNTENAIANVAVSAAANNVTVQGTNPSYESGENAWAPSWSRPARYAPSSPDVEAAHPKTPSATSAAATPAAATPSSGTGPVPLDIDPAVLVQMQKAHWAMRILYMTACILMGAAAGLSLVPTTSTTSGTGASSTMISQNQGTAANNVGTAFFAVYVLFFCLLMCCFEVGINMFSSVLAINFGFLYTLSGRLIFVLFVGFMSFSLSQFGIAAMAYLYLVGVLHVGIMLYFPKFSEWVRQKDYFGSRAVR